MTARHNRIAVFIEADVEAIIENLISGQYSDPLRVVGFNTAERWSQDVSEDIALEVQRRHDIAGEDVPCSIRTATSSVALSAIAAYCGTTAVATTIAGVRRSMVMHSRVADGGVRPNATENGQISPSTTVRAARGAGSRPQLASAFQGSRKSANIQTSSGVIWGIPAQV